MADLYPQTYSTRQAYHRQDSQPYGLGTTNASLVYPPQLLTTSQPTLSDEQQQQSQQQQQQQQQATQQQQQQHDASSQSPSRDSPSPKHESPPAQKAEGAPQQAAKPQATFLTKLYALLERPENHHMIRWDPAGEHIIVERPEQLALHVLPSVYRQSRFASFSRQLNIYGFMRKVNLRNVDPAIDDPDASTWSHPTLNRHSPPEVVANFKRRVPPRLPKPRKRDNEVPPIAPPRSAIGMGPVPLSSPTQTLSPNKGAPRARGFSAPGSFSPLNQPGAPGWTSAYSRSTLPPLTVPSDPPMSSHTAMYSHSAHPMHPITPTDDAPSSASFSSMAYASSGRDAMMLPSPSSQYPYTEQASNWSFSPTSAASSHSSGSLSSLLNPSSNVNGGYSNASRPQPPAINTYTSYNNIQMSRNHHSAGGLSPDSRPTSGYSVSSMSSMQDNYGDSQHYSHHDYSRPGSSHHQSTGRPLTPSSSRPPSSKSYNSGSLSIRRARRHSQAMQPYPSPYAEHPPLSAGSERPSSSPQPDEHPGGIQRVRSMIQLPSVDTYGFNPSQADFAYGAVDDSHGQHGHAMYGVASGRSVRPSTSASSLSTSSSAANTPGGDGFGAGAGEADINRCE
ncbi:uncharacterized protein LAESUDRAFT_639685 [Laetiporus sulphureus 93-53]|uniref:HSF-type DNA-binding domain-containing protein n=1 Tax=Laetiporus sulphureus 93-53 TaxID=1314785 RepID=A0A165IER8_9APHY|nr:uncharacterized protein LAESUDRAFT_639685 [Laetiporus sulphureus 93-53]KZT12976.1 hypothetical protein LAESUDRAFT_639685 [Laetiporus sulphureus 93-53]